MIQALILFTQFFTRIPMPINIPDGINKFRKSIQYLAVFGFLVGCLEGLFFWLVNFIFPSWFAWILVWVMDGFITGGFDIDALADTADGLFSALDEKKIRIIMKDSRLGTRGSLALFYFYFLAISSGIILCQYLSKLRIVTLIIVMFMISKAGMSILLYKMSPVKNKKSLAYSWTNIATWKILINQLFSFFISTLFLGLAGLISNIVVVLCVLLYRKYLYKKFSYLSGDLIGSAANLSQVIFLLIYIIFIRGSL